MEKLTRQGKGLGLNVVFGTFTTQTPITCIKQRPSKLRRDRLRHSYPLATPHAQPVPHLGASQSHRSVLAGDSNRCGLFPWSDPCIALNHQGHKR